MGSNRLYSRARSSNAANWLLLRPYRPQAVLFDLAGRLYVRFGPVWAGLEPADVDPLPYPAVSRRSIPDATLDLTALPRISPGGARNGDGLPGSAYSAGACPWSYDWWLYRHLSGLAAHLLR